MLAFVDSQWYVFSVYNKLPVLVLQDRKSQGMLVFLTIFSY